MKKFLRTLAMAALLTVPWLSQAQTSVTPPYSTGFESGDDVAWTFVNGTTNKWCIGTATNNGGTSSMYISNDEGVSTAYSGTTQFSFAYKDVNLAVGEYNIQFDWKCKGESTWDYMRVFLVPSSVTLTTSSLGTATSSTRNNVPSGWINIASRSDNPTSYMFLNLQESWQTWASSVSITSAGTYHFVFVWCNDASGNYSPAACVDNIMLTALSCPAPVVSATGISQTGLTLQWDTTGYGESTYSVSYTAGGNSYYLTSTTDSVDITGLTAETSYTFNVRRICSATDSSAVRAFTATTAYAPISLPYSTGFESSEIVAYNGSTAYKLPAHWVRYNNATSTTYVNHPYAYSSSTYAHTGSYSLYTYRNTTATYGDTALVALPIVDVAQYPMNNNQIKFWARASNTSYAVPVQVGTMTDPNDRNTFVADWSFTVTGTTHEQYEFTLGTTAASAAGVCAAILIGRPAGAVSIYIDDLVLEQQPSCPKPMVTASNVLHNGMTLNFDTAGHSGATYLVSYTVGTDEYNLTATGASIDITGLAAETDYTFNVRRVCSATDTSAVRTVSFTTSYAPISLPYSTGFESSEIVAYNGNTTYKLPANWTRHNNATSTTYVNHPYAYSSSTYAHTGSYSLYRYGGASATYGTSAFAVLPKVDTALFPMANNEFILWMRGSSASVKEVFVGTMSDPNDTTTFVADTLIELASTTYAEYELKLGTTAASAAGAYPVIKFGKAVSTSTVYIDDLELIVQPTCLKPQNLAATVTSNSATLTWANANTGNTTTLYAIHNGDTVYGTAAAGDTTYTFTGLAAHTSYVFAARAVCSATDSSRLAVLASMYTQYDGHEITAFGLSGAGKRGDVEFDTVGDHSSIIVPVWYTDNLATGYTFTWTLSTSAAMFVDTAADGSYTCQVTTTTIKNYLQMNTPLTVRVKAQDRALYSDYTLVLQTESCVAARNLTLSAERIRYTATWDNPDTTVTTFHFVHSATRLDSAALSTAQYTTVSNAHRYTVDGLSRETKYYAYVKSACDTVWIEDSVTTLGLGACGNIVIGDSTSTSTSYYYPINTYYNYSLTETIIDAAELGGSRSLTSMKFHYHYTSGLSSATNVTVWLKPTTKTVFEDEEDIELVDATAVQVYSGAFNFTQGWNEITFTTPYSYDGVSNLMVIVDDNSADYDGSSYTFTTSSCTGYKTLHWYDDDENPSPTSAIYDGNMDVASNRVVMAFPYCTPANACPDVTAIAADSITSTTAKIVWTASDADYSVGTQVIVSATMLDSAALSTATGTALAAYAESYNATGLTPDQDYYVYIRALCNGTDHNEGMSGWATATFHTFPTCRVPEVVSIAATGKHTARLVVENTGTELNQANNFSYILSTTKLDATALAAATPTATGIDTTVIDLSGLLSATKYYVYVQNVCPTENCSSPWSAPDSLTMPSAMPAPILAASNVSYSSLTALWVRDLANFADETAWRIAIKEHGVAPVAADWETVSDTTDDGVAYHLFSYLTPDTAYDVYVAPYDAATQTTGDTARLDSVRTAAFPSACEIIGEGTSSSYYFYPGFYGWQYSAALYDIDQTGIIRSFSVENINAVSTSGDTLQVWVKVVDTATFTMSTAIPFSTLIAGATSIYHAADNTTTAGWREFAFPSPISVSEGQRLLILTRGVGCSASGGCSKQVRATSVSGMFFYKAQDGSDPGESTVLTSTTGARPNIQLCYQRTDSCLAVTTVYAMDVQANEATLTWYPGFMETSWQYFLSCDTAAINAGTVALQTTQTNTINPTGLLRDTTYYFGMRPICSATQYGPWKIVSINTPYVDYYYDVTVIADTTMGRAEGLAQVLEGTDTTIVATPNHGYRFVSWTMGTTVLGTSDTLHITVDSNMTITANFAINQYTVSATVNPAAAGSVSGAGTVNHGALDTLVATANDGYRFVNWTTGSTVLGTADTLVLTVVSDTTVVANFEAIPTYTVSVSVNDNNMGSVSGVPTAAVREGTSVSLTATATTGNRFVNWTSGTTVLGTATALTVVVVSDTAITANFEAIPPTTYTVHVGVNDATMGSVSPAGDSTVAEGTVFTATATANDGYRFVDWSNGETNATISVTVSSDLTLTANFEVDGQQPDTNYYTVTVTANDDAMGSVTGAGTYAEGTTVTLSAEANDGYHFVSWSNGATSTVITFVVESDTTFTATFEENDPNVTYYTITGVANDATMGVVLGSGQYEEGATVTLTAMANNGYRFVSWSNGETTATITFTATEDVTLTATFEAVTGIEDAVADDVKVYSTDSKIIVRGAEGRSIYVFDVNGRMITREATAGETAEFRMQSTGVYLVKVGTAAAKRVLVVR